MDVKYSPTWIMDKFGQHPRLNIRTLCKKWFPSIPCVWVHISASYWWIFIIFKIHRLYQHGIMTNSRLHKFGKIQDGC
jgi:hypothetical protein